MFGYNLLLLLLTSTDALQTLLTSADSLRTHIVHLLIDLVGSIGSENSENLGTGNGNGNGSQSLFSFVPQHSRKLLVGNALVQLHCSIGVTRLQTCLTIAMHCTAQFGVAQMHRRCDHIANWGLLSTGHPPLDCHLALLPIGRLSL